MASYGCGGVGHLACQNASRSFGLRAFGINVKRKESLVRDSGAKKYLALGDYDGTHIDGDISATSQAAKNIMRLQFCCSSRMHRQTRPLPNSSICYDSTSCLW